MPEVRVEQWDVECEVLETLPLIPGSSSPIYPQPKLQRTGRFAQVSLQTVELTNDLIKVVICPDLGGRVIELVDVRTGAAGMRRPEVIRPDDDPLFGTVWNHGLWLDAGSQGLGPVDFQVRNDLGAVFLHHLVPGVALSWTLSMSLRGDDPVLTMEARVYNRSLLPVQRCPDLCCSAGGGEILTFGDSDFIVGEATGFRLHSPAGTWTGSTVIHERLRLQRRAPQVLLPRETDAWSMHIHVFSGQHKPTFAFPNGIVCADKVIEIHADELWGECTLYVRTPEGDALEADASLGPTIPFEAEVGFIPQAIAVKLGGQKISAEPLVKALDSENIVQSSILNSMAGWPSLDSVESRFFSAVSEGETFHGSVPGLPSVSSTWRAVMYLRGGDFSSAILAIEQALLTNSEDHLAWWMKAVCERHLDQFEEATLLNAHFLAPLEPVLMAESMLSAWAHDPEAPRVLPPSLSGDATSLLEVLSLYQECGLYKDMSDILNATTNRARPALVSYVNAWLYIVQSDLLAEAAHHVAAGSAIEVEAPLPWRRTELLVVRELADRFPQDTRLRTWATLIEDVKPSA